MTRLNRGERLVLSVLRRLAHGWDPCILATRDLECRGDTAAEVLSSVRLFIVTVARTARRRMQVAPPGWRELTTDERQILSLVSSAQRQDESMLEAMATWSARLEVRAVLIRTARELAATLTACGMSAQPEVAAGAEHSGTEFKSEYGSFATIR